MIEIQANTDGDKLDLLITRLGDANITRIMQEASKVSFETATKLCFAGSSAPDGSPWKQLAPSTIRKKKREGKYPSQILIDGGKLRGSFTTQARGNNSIFFGTNVAYAPYHQYGTRKMPARPFLPTTEDNLNDFVAELSDALFEGLQ